MAIDHVRVNCLAQEHKAQKNPEGLKPMCLESELKHTNHLVTTAPFPLETVQYKIVSYNYIFAII